MRTVSLARGWYIDSRDVEVLYRKSNDIRHRNLPVSIVCRYLE